MRLSFLNIAALATALCSASALGAQTRPGPGPRARPGQEQRAALRDRLKTATPEARKAALDKAKERRSEAGGRTASDEQKAWIKAMHAQRQTTHAAVKAGTLTRQSAAEQLKAWRAANPRPGRG